jgi:Flp pilus assembly protein TadG
MLYHPRILPRTPRRGVIAVLVAVSLLAILGVVALVLDGGVLMAERRHAQEVADAAALAAACDLYANYSTNNGLDPSGTAKASALATAAADGYANDGTTSTVTVHIPPTSGDYVGKAGYAEVLVQYNQSRYFSQIYASATIPVTARAVATGASNPYSKASILVLDSSGKDALNVSGTGVTGTGGPIIVDSNNSEAANASGSAKVTAPEIDITGNYNASGSASFNGTVKTGQTATADPLAALPVPDKTTYTTQSSSKLSYSSGSHTLSPGRYIGGITISSPASVTLSPGEYYIDGGGITVSGGATLSGSNVMIYNAPTSSSEGLVVSGGSVLTLTPPTSGTYQGLTFFQDRSSSAKADISGGSGMSVKGTIYIAGALLNVSGSSGVMNFGSQYVVKDLTVSGSATIQTTWAAATVAGYSGISLVE